jgi:hypothetical protein
MEIELPQNEIKKEEDNIVGKIILQNDNFVYIKINEQQGYFQFFTKGSNGSLIEMNLTIKTQDLSGKKLIIDNYFGQKNVIFTMVINPYSPHNIRDMQLKMDDDNNFLQNLDEFSRAMTLSINDNRSAMNSQEEYNLLENLLCVYEVTHSINNIQSLRDEINKKIDLNLSSDCIGSDINSLLIISADQYNENKTTYNQQKSKINNNIQSLENKQNQLDGMFNALMNNSRTQINCIKNNTSNDQQMIDLYEQYKKFSEFVESEIVKINHDTKIAELELNIKHLDRNIYEIDKNITNLDRNIHEIEEDIKKLAMNITKLEMDIKALKNQTQQLDSTVNTQTILKEKLETSKKDLLVLKKKLQDNPVKLYRDYLLKNKQIALIKILPFAATNLSLIRLTGDSENVKKYLSDVILNLVDKPNWSQLTNDQKQDLFKFILLNNVKADTIPQTLEQPNTNNDDKDIKLQLFNNHNIKFDHLFVFSPLLLTYIIDKQCVLSGDMDTICQVVQNSRKSNIEAKKIFLLNALNKYNQHLSSLLDYLFISCNDIHPEEQTQLLCNIFSYESIKIALLEFHIQIQKQDTDGKIEQFLQQIQLSLNVQQQSNLIEEEKFNN